MLRLHWEEELGMAAAKFAGGVPSRQLRQGEYGELRAVSLR